MPGYERGPIVDQNVNHSLYRSRLTKAMNEYFLLENHLFAPVERLLGIGLSRSARAFFALMPLMELLAIFSARIPWNELPTWFTHLYTIGSFAVFGLLVVFAADSLDDLLPDLLRSGMRIKTADNLIETNQVVIRVSSMTLALGGWKWFNELYGFFWGVSVALPMVWVIVLGLHMDARAGHAWQKTEERPAAQARPARQPQAPQKGQNSQTNTQPHKSQPRPLERNGLQPVYIRQLEANVFDLMRKRDTVEQNEASKRYQLYETMRKLEQRVRDLEMERDGWEVMADPECDVCSGPWDSL